MLSVVLDPVVLHPSKNHSCWISYLCHQAKVVGFLFHFVSVLVVVGEELVLRQLQDPSS